eukprot:CAMPEP_0117423540 /NCGR_PEP_ID=MMETSP0758-20121206/4137_1 /TAXON_ID=63605 /ORGANISM="Percolomonas cosmopolitus, Strain AE-1 (ATCC 50343)" /LENGTH=1064 /DNA_ID=CAMNT_0005206777 /DNA_START=927 /DNA_END=4117 /DNA_ORIENTATION=+
MNLIFLPRSVGKVKGELKIETNKGTLIHQIRGEGEESAYKIKPVIGYTVPLDLEYNLPIKLYNPHNHQLEIKEIYTSEDFLRLDMTEALKSSRYTANTIWKLAVGDEREVIFLKFRAKQPGKYQGFVHIKTNVDTIIVHIEFNVQKNGIHPLTEIINFGTLTKDKEIVSRDIILLNINQYPVSVQSMYVPKQISQLGATFQKNIVIQPESSERVATITFKGTHAKPKIQGGNIYFKTNDTSNEKKGKIKIAYEAIVEHGELKYTPESTSFFIHDKGIQQKTFTVKNTFKVPVYIQDAYTLNDKFEILNFKQQTIQPSKTADLFSIQVNSLEYTEKSKLIIHTNISTVSIDLFAFDGRLKLLKKEDDTNLKNIRFDCFDINMKQQKYYKLVNTNPIPVTLTSWKLQYQRDEQSDFHIQLYKENTPIQSKVVIEPSQHVVMKLSGSAQNTTSTVGKVVLDTNILHMEIPVQFNVMRGELSFSPISEFSNSFPGSIQKRILFVGNTYNRPIEIKRIQSSDKRFKPVLKKMIIPPNEKMNIGYIYYNPGYIKQELNYMLDRNHNRHRSSNDHHFTKVTTPDEMTNYEYRTRLYSTLKKKGLTTAQAMITIDTDLFKTIQIKVHSNLIIPKLHLEETLHFSKVKLGQEKKKYVTIDNPADLPVHVRLEIGCDRKYSLFHPNGYDRNMTRYMNHKDFSIEGEGLIEAVIPPKERILLGPILYTPSTIGLSHAMLYIRNNLTILDKMEIAGVGANGKLEFEHLGQRMGQEIHFDIQSHHIGKFDEEGQFYLKKSGDSKRQTTSDVSSSQKKETIISYTHTFTLKNSGNIDILILKSSVAGQGCSAFGITLHNCKTIHLRPNEQTTYSITYEPDFSQAQFISEIQFMTNKQETLIYPISFTLPEEMLPHLQKYTNKNIKMKWLISSGVVILLSIGAFLLYNRSTPIKEQLPKEMPMKKEIRESPEPLDKPLVKETVLPKEKLKKKKKKKKKVTTQQQPQQQPTKKVEPTKKVTTQQQPIEETKPIVEPTKSIDEPKIVKKIVETTKPIEKPLEETTTKPIVETKKQPIVEST